MSINGLAHATARSSSTGSTANTVSAAPKNPAEVAIEPIFHLGSDLIRILDAPGGITAPPNSLFPPQEKFNKLLAAAEIPGPKQARIAIRAFYFAFTGEQRYQASLRAAETPGYPARLTQAEKAVKLAESNDQRFNAHYAAAKIAGPEREFHIRRALDLSHAGHKRRQLLRMLGNRPGLAK